jgi:predicted short-subunit dehydrogenase-like oxidoreductase (DUF2520 family)
MLWAWEQYNGFRFSASGFRMLASGRSAHVRPLIVPEAEWRKPEAASAILPGMVAKPRVAIIGAGNFGTALALGLHRAGYVIDAVVARARNGSLPKARTLAKRVGAHATKDLSDVQAELIWICVPDGAIAHVARSLAGQTKWNGRVAVHSSGALTSDELSVLRECGAAVASVHPLMTFVRGSQPALLGVSFAMEGDAVARRAARRVIGNLGGRAYLIRKQDKAAYHALATFASPLFTALLATTEQVATLAGVTRKGARQRMIPILQQTLANYAAFGAARAFSGPIVRGDLDTVKRHLHVLRALPAARDVYLELARSALRYLPVKKKNSLQRILETS